MSSVSLLSPCPVPSGYSVAPLEAGDAQGAIRALHEKGFALLRGVYDQTAVKTLREAVCDLEFTPPADVVHQNHVLYTTIFNRDPRFLAALDPQGVIEVIEAAVGEDCHLVNQKAWRALPGHQPGPLHSDALFVPMPEELCTDTRWQPTIFIVSALTYLDDIDAELSPTVVVPGSHRSGRCPHHGETSWRGNQAQAILCRAGDVVMFRCELWHSGSPNQTADRTRHVIETAYGQRTIAQKFWPYVNFRHEPSILSAANPRQRRLMGEHPLSNYG